MMEPVQQPDVRQSRRSVWFKRESIDQIPFKQIFGLQSGVILLFSWPQVNWVAYGSVHQESIYFNSVCEKLFLVLASIALALDGAKRTFLAQISPECTNSFRLLTLQI